MANKLKTNILQAIADFDDMEAALEECGVDVPYDTDTATYGDKVRLAYAKGAEDAKSVFNAETHYDFPSVGSVDVIYKAQSEQMIYQWNPTELKYEPLCSAETKEINLINGGSASGDSYNENRS